MITMNVSRAIVSQGYNGAAPIRQSEDGKVLSFSIGIPKYDKNAPNNTRWVNMKVKAFGQNVARVGGMKLEAGYHVSLSGEYDVEEWTDKQTGEKRSAPALILHAIEYANNGGSNNANGSGSGRKGGKGGGSGNGGNADNPPASDPNDLGDINLDSDYNDNDLFDDDDI